MKRFFVVILSILTLFITACSLTYEEEYAQAAEANEKAYNYCLENDCFMLRGSVGPKIDKYYGKYGDVYVVDPESSASFGAVIVIKIESYEFAFPSDAHVPYAIYKNRYYELDDAYEKGYLSLKDIGKIYELCEK